MRGEGREGKEERWGCEKGGERGEGREVRV